ncbi:hypothetical protein [Streptomyces sp. NPDC059533]|uniref:hypothetical protein n=1 Tax=unclassified Streptomyces TaxID=2593676 RepID=UPI003694E038
MTAPSQRGRSSRARLPRRAPAQVPGDLHKERTTVERLMGELEALRCIATRYDKTPDGHLAGLHRRASMIRIKDLTRTTR